MVAGPSIPTLLGGCTKCAPGVGVIEENLASSSMVSLALVGLALLSHSLYFAKKLTVLKLAPKVYSLICPLLPLRLTTKVQLSMYWSPAIKTPFASPN